MDATGQAEASPRTNAPEEQPSLTEQPVVNGLAVSTASTSVVLPDLRDVRPASDVVPASDVESASEVGPAGDVEDLAVPQNPVDQKQVDAKAEAEPSPGEDLPTDPAADGSAAGPVTVRPGTAPAGAGTPAGPDVVGTPEAEAAPAIAVLPDAGSRAETGSRVESGNRAEAEAEAEPRFFAGHDLRGAAQRLRNQVAGVSLALELPEVATVRRDRELLLAQLDDYLLPRLARMDAPLLAVIGGSTGAGKSTLTNSLARKVVSRSGVLRPTTRSPVLVHHPYDSGAFLTQRILPGLDRITSEALEPLQPVEFDAPRITALRLVPHEGLTSGLALLDAPDIDSVVEANRDLAVQLLGAADLWVFVTTAARYGDAMPWQMLRTAAERGLSVAVVLDRVPPESLQEVRQHFARMLRDRGLGSSPLFVIPELPLNDGLLPWNVVAPLHRWLTRLGKDPASRRVIVRRTLTGIVESLPQRGRRLVAAAAEQEVAAHVLGTELDAVFATARSTLIKRLANGTVFRGEVLARWRELTSSGELVRHLERASGRLSDRMLTAVRRPPPLSTEPLGRALASAVSAIIDGGVRETVDHAQARWRELPGGAGLVTRAAAATAGRAAPGSGTAIAVPELVRHWQAGVLAAVGSLPTQPRMTGRTLALRPESVVVLVTVVCLIADNDPADSVTATGQLSVAELAELAEGAWLVRRLLQAVYGEPAIRLLVEAAREDLRSRVEELLSIERAALKALLDDAKVRHAVAEALLAAVKVVENAR